MATHACALTSEQEVEIFISGLREQIAIKVKEEIQSELMTHGFGNRTHEATMPTESRTLQLKFLDGVSGPVLTGKEIEGKGGTAMRLDVVDSTTGKLLIPVPKPRKRLRYYFFRQMMTMNTIGAPKTSIIRSLGKVKRRNLVLLRVCMCASRKGWASYLISS
ncbi:calmodulin-binding protein 60 A-like isoform X2 [Primulina eburnea]|uniref:calmodulin-binding protein 60 A-like isoform X1 n=1 Tax=Primulina eburnea TaxID=1245227 RepID=UPI003C6C5F38